MRSVTKKEFNELKANLAFYELDMSLPEGASSGVKFYASQINEEEVMIISIFNNDFPTGFNISIGEIVECEGKYIIDGANVFEDEEDLLSRLTEKEDSDTSETNSQEAEDVVDDFSFTALPKDDLGIVEGPKKVETVKEPESVVTTEAKQQKASKTTFEEDLASFNPEKEIQSRLEEKQLQAILGSTYDKEFVGTNNVAPKEEVSNESILEKLRNNTVEIENKKQGPYVKHGEKKSTLTQQSEPQHPKERKVNKPEKVENKELPSDDELISSVFNPFAGQDDDFVF